MNMRARGMSACVVACLGSIAYAQDLSQRVTMDALAAPSARIVQDLATKTGVKLEVSPSLDRDVLILKVRDVELKALMDQIAVAVSGEWKQDGEVWRLSKDAPKHIAEERKELQDRTALVRKALKEMRDSLKPKPEKSGEGEQEAAAAAEATSRVFAMQGFGGGAANKAIITLLSSLDASVIAAMPKDGRVVFATNPTRMQRPLTLDSATVNEIITQHNATVEASKKAKAENEANVPPEMAQMQEWAERFMPGFSRRLEPIASAPTKVMLVITRAGMFGGTQASLKFFDAKGQVIFESSQGIPLGESFMEQMDDVEISPQGQVIPKKAPETAEDGPVIKLSPISEEMSSTFSRYYGPGADEPQLSKELAERLLQPDRFDPLSYDVSESVLAMAEFKKLNVVANMPDSVAGGIFRMMSSERKQTAGGYYKQLKSGETAVIESNGWLVVRPSKPAEARRTRVDREALAKLIKSSVGREIPPLDDMAAYALKAEDPQSTPIAMPYFANFAANVMQGGMMGQLNWDMLRLYGTLTASQRQGLMTGGKINFSTLSPDQRDIVTRMAFGASANLRVDRPGDKPKEDEFDMFSMMAMMAEGRGVDFRDEPTEVMPSGLPGSGYLDVKVTAENFALVVGQKGGTVKQYGALGPDELAVLKYFTEDPNFQEVAAQIPKFEKFRIGDRTTMEFKFHLAPDVRLEHSLRDDKLGQNAAVVEESGFPAKFRARIDQRVASLKKNPFPAFGIGMGQAVPPP
ncbi:MAG: hypothetical protein K1X67_24985 [Fimbriimonadaceae bacterium]|nr:hypothetical protein [Fimbriimonadaceae bacterium]